MAADYAAYVLSLKDSGSIDIPQRSARDIFEFLCFSVKFGFFFFPLGVDDKGIKQSEFKQPGKCF